jgi:hypothetical protein
MTDFLVNRDDLRQCRIDSGEEPQIGAGQALLRVDSFGLTANNITYAVMGEAMSYWDFFPAAEGWGRVPMWGFAEVERSEAEDVDPGARLYGYLPPSSHLVVAPTGADERGFVDGSPHRAALPPVYNRYLAAASDPFYRQRTEEMQMLLRPLFFTSFLIDDQLADEGLAGRGLVVFSSASSKTAIAAAFLLGQREGVELVGLTSPAAPSSWRAWGSTGAQSHTTRSSRWGEDRRRSSTSPATGRCAARSTPTSATHSSTAWWSAPPTGRSSGPAERASFQVRSRPSSSRRIGSLSAQKIGVAPSSRRGWPAHGTRSATGSPAGWR